MDHEGQTGIIIDSAGHRLMGTLFMPPGEAPRPTAVLLHGLPGIEKLYDVAHALRDLGWCSLLFHYRGSWGSEGAYRFKNLPADVKAAVDFLSRGDYPHVDTNRLVLIGHSMGGWAAVLAAVADPRIKAMAALGAVTDPKSWIITHQAAAQDCTPWLNGVTPAQMVEEWAGLNEEWSPVEQVHRLAPRPLLVLHGGADKIVPHRQGQALYERAGEPKEIIIMPDANHAFSWHRPALRKYLLEWLDRVVSSE